MFVIETEESNAARKMSVVLIIATALTASFGVLLTLHTYVRPQPRVEGFRVFGFRLDRRGRKSAA
jgi:hypothetical protein